KRAVSVSGEQSDILAGGVRKARKDGLRPVVRHDGVGRSVPVEVGGKDEPVVIQVAPERLGRQDVEQRRRRAVLEPLDRDPEKVTSHRAPNPAGREGHESVPPKIKRANDGRRNAPTFRRSRGANRFSTLRTKVNRRTIPDKILPEIFRMASLHHVYAKVN